MNARDAGGIELFTCSLSHGSANKRIMSAQELVRLVFQTIDKHSDGLTQEQYLEMLEIVRDDAEIRAEAVRDELGM